MRIVATSDIRYTPERHAILSEWVASIAEQSPDAVVVAGNLGESVDQFSGALLLFEKLHCAKAAVLGNRDIWHRIGDFSSERLWAEILPATLENAGFTYLEKQNLVIGQVGICGTIAWYDYSSRDPVLRYTVDQYQELKGLVNFDAQYIDWARRDQAFAADLQGNFGVRLDELERDRSINHIIVVTHIPVFGDAITHSPTDLQWNFGAAYSFNLTLGRVIVPHAKVRHVVSGHVRSSGDWSVSFGANLFHARLIGHDDHIPHAVTLDIGGPL